VKVSNFEKYQKAPLLELEDMPTKEELANSAPKLIIIAEKSPEANSEELKAQSTIRNNLITELQSKKYATIVERIDSNAIQQEIKISEMAGKSSKGVIPADYILNISTPTLSFSSEVSDQSPLAIVVAGGTSQRAQESSYLYKASVNSSAKLYSLPSLKMEKVIEFTGNVAQKEKVQKTDSFWNAQIKDAKTSDANMMLKATQDAAYKATLELKKFFKKKAFVAEKRVLKNKVIYLINKGTEDDFSSQKKVSIIRILTERDPLTDEEQTSEENVCVGTVSDKAFAKSSWVVFDKKCQEKVRLGDKAVILY
jgi:hypothetical protein